MRLRLGLLRDTSANLEKAEALEKKRRVNETLQKMKELETAQHERVRSDVPVDPIPPALTKDKDGKVPAPRIRPLSESKAIDAGANFISEAFLFAVAGGLILFENVRSRRKEASRRDTVQERLELLENRKRQDEMRLEEQERINKVQQERLLALEREMWKLMGRKEEGFPGEKVDVKEWTPTPLWEKPKKKEGGYWERVWTLGRQPKEGEVEEKEEKKEEKKEKKEEKAKGKEVVVTLKSALQPAEKK